MNSGARICLRLSQIFFSHFFFQKISFFFHFQIFFSFPKIPNKNIGPGLRRFSESVAMVGLRSLARREGVTNLKVGTKNILRVWPSNFGSTNSVAARCSSRITRYQCPLVDAVWNPIVFSMRSSTSSTLSPRPASPRGFV